jgi:hypothetical protein
MAAVRNLAIGVLSRTGPVNAAALWFHSRDPHRSLATLGISLGSNGHHARTPEPCGPPEALRWSGSPRPGGRQLRRCRYRLSREPGCRAGRTCGWVPAHPAQGPGGVGVPRHAPGGRWQGCAGSPLAGASPRSGSWPQPWPWWAGSPYWPPPGPAADPESGRRPDHGHGHAARWGCRAHPAAPSPCRRRVAGIPCRR